LLGYPIVKRTVLKIYLLTPGLILSADVSLFAITPKPISTQPYRIGRCAAITADGLVCRLLRQKIRRPVKLGTPEI